MRHPHLQYRDFVLGFELKQVQRQSEVIVEVASRLVDSQLRGKNMSDCFLSRRLSRGTSYPDNLLAPDTTYSRTERLQRDKSVVHRKQSTLHAVAGDSILTNYRGDSSRGQSALD